MAEMVARGQDAREPAPDARHRDLSDLQRLIQYVETRRAQLSDAAGGAFDRRVIDATILLSKLWVAVINLRLRQAT